jgi:dTDP-4-dehydrorhamnose reductase
MADRQLLVFGAGGQVGLELLRAAAPAGLAAVAVPRMAADICDPAAVAAALDRPGCAGVINAAAYTAVDRAESEPAAAHAVNRDGAANLARACAARGVPLIHISTDYVFDGTKDGPYEETDPVAPLGVYGASKATGEAAVRAALDRHLIVRTAWVFSPFGANFVKTMLRLGAERPELRVVDDQRGCPTAAADIAAALLVMARWALTDGFGGWGTYHFCSAESTTWCGFARAVFATAAVHGRPAPKVAAITTAEYPTPAKRPANSVLSTARIGAAFGIEPPSWRASLRACVGELLAGETGGRS